MWNIGPKLQRGNWFEGQIRIRKSNSNVPLSPSAEQSIDARKMRSNYYVLLLLLTSLNLLLPFTFGTTLSLSLSLARVLDLVQERCVYVYMFCVVSSGMRWREHWTTIQFELWLNFFNYISLRKGLILLISSQKEGFDFVFLR